MKKHLTVLIISFIFLISCAPLPQPKPENIEKTITVQKSFDEVWVNLIEYLSSRQIQIRTMEKNSGFLDTDYMVLDYDILADYAWSGTPLPSMARSEGRIKANIFVKKINDNETSITVNTNVGVYYDISSISSSSRPKWENAKSTGKFESEIINIFKQ